jgi:hypothetical protein
MFAKIKLLTCAIHFTFTLAWSSDLTLCPSRKTSRPTSRGWLIYAYLDRKHGGCSPYRKWVAIEKPSISVFNFTGLILQFLGSISEATTMDQLRRAFLTLTIPE